MKANINSIKSRLQHFSNAKGMLYLSLVIVVLFHAIIKFSTIENQSVQGDEAYSVFNSQQNISEFLHTFKVDGEANPALFFLLLHFWIKLFGISFFAVKSLSITLSIGTAIFLFLTAKKIGDYWFAFFVSSCFLFSDFHFDYSHEIRAFQLVLFLSIVSFYCFISFLQDKRGRWLVPLVILNAALPYSHYNSVLVPFVQFIASFFFLQSDKKLIFKLWISYFVSFVIFLPQLFTFFKIVPGKSFWIGISTWADLEFVLFKLIGFDEVQLWLIVPYFLSIPLLVIGIRFSWFIEKFSWKIFITFWMLFIVPILVNYLIAQSIPCFQVKYILFTNFGIYLSLGYLFIHLKRIKWLVRACFVLLAYQFVTYFEAKTLNNERWDEKAKFIKTFKKKEDALFISASYKLNDFLYYYDKEAFADYRNIDGFLLRNNIFLANGERFLESVGDLNRFDKIFYLQSHSQFQDPENLILKALNERRNLCRQIGNPPKSGISEYNLPSKDCFSFELLLKSKEFLSLDAHWFWDVFAMSDTISNTMMTHYLLNNSIGSKSFVLSKALEFSPCREILANQISSIDCTLDFSSLLVPTASLIISIEHNGVSINRHEYMLKDFYINKKGSMRIGATIGDDYPKGTIVKIYVWNHENPVINIQNLSIKLYKSNWS